MFSRHKFPFLPASFPAWGTFVFKMLLPSVPRLLLTIPGPDTLGEGADPGCSGVTRTKLLFDTDNRGDPEYNTAIKNGEQFQMSFFGHGETKNF